MEQSNLEFNQDTFIEVAGDDVEDLGGKKYLQEILKKYEPNNNIEFHIEQLKTDKLKFDLYSGPASDFMDALTSRSANKSELVRIASQIHDEMRYKAQAEYITEGERLGEEYVKEFNARFTRPFVGTGFKELDEKLVEGFSPATISVISGRPSMGKTIFMLNCISNLIHSKKMLICEIEMGSITLVDMLVSLHTNISLDKIIKYVKQLTPEEKLRVEKQVKSMMKNENLNFLDDPTLTLDRLEIELKNKKYDICFIDLFSRLSDVITTSEGFTRKLYQAKRIARLTNTHLCLIHQIRRRGENKENQSLRPSLERLKDSGTWEEVGDLIFGIHREKYYRPTLQKDIMEIIILKQKRGESNVIVPFAFNGRIAEVGDFEANYVHGLNLETF